MQHVHARAIAIALSVVAGFIIWKPREAAAADAPTYLVDPAKGDDANPAGQPWKTFGKLNSVKLAPGD